MAEERRPWDNDPAYVWDDDPFNWDDFHVDDGGIVDDDADAPYPRCLGNVEAGDMMLQILLELRWKNRLSARGVCIIAWCAKQGGMAGGIREFALHPNAQSGHFQRKLDKELGISPDATLYDVLVPSFTKWEKERFVAPIPFCAVHEVIEDEVRHAPDQFAKLQKMLDEDELPLAYLDHPVVRAAPPATVLPLSIYIDGLPITKTDGVIGFHVKNLVTGARHICGTLRKSRLCKCGCRGWCSIFPVLCFMEYCCWAMIDKVMPAGRHDHLAWRLTDAAREMASGAALSFCAIVVKIAGDWSEYCTTLGMPTWAAKFHPCLFCFVTLAQLLDPTPLSPGEFPYERKDETSYDLACRRCEIWVTLLSPEVHKRVLDRLHYKKGEKGPRGRAMKHPLPELGLLTNDRLEPSELLHDVGAFDLLVPTAAKPLRVLFWRRSEETSTRHRCPLLSPRIHTSLYTLIVDTLHAWYLGIAQRFLGWLWWQFVDDDFFGTGGTTIEARTTDTIQRLRFELKAFYAESRAKLPAGKRVAQLDDLCPKHLGTRGGNYLKSKAAETRPLVEFSEWLLLKTPGKLMRSDELVLFAVRSLREMFDVCHYGKARLTVPETQRLYDAYNRHITAMSSLGIDMLPKHHVSAHVLDKLEAHGNPRCSAVFEDEAFNGKLADICAHSFQSNFYWRVIAEFIAAHGPKHMRHAALDQLKRKRTV